MRAILLVVLGWVAVAGCGGDDDGECETVNQRVCDLACDCAEGDACRIQLGAVTLTHENPGDCAGFWVNLACGQDEADEVDYPACSAALDSAACVETDDGMALAYPSAECGDSQQ